MIKMHFREQQKNIFATLKNMITQKEIAEILVTTTSQVSRYKNLDRELPKAHFDNLMHVIKLFELPAHDSLIINRKRFHSNEKYLRDYILADEKFAYYFINKKTWLVEISDDWKWDVNVVVCFGNAMSTDTSPLIDAPTLLNAYLKFCSSEKFDFKIM